MKTITTRLVLGAATIAVMTITMVTGEHVLWLVAVPLWLVWAGWEHRIFLAKDRS